MVVEYTHQQECTKIAQYMVDSEYPTDKGRRVRGLIPWSQVVNKGYTTNYINKDHKRGLDNMKMHGQNFKQQSKLASVNIEGVNKWLHSSHLRFEMESLVFAEQEQALATNVIKAKISSQGG